MAGSGTRDDPWLVDSYAELVSKAALDGFIRINKNINITDEYPEGDMPTLSMGDCDIDGNGKIITNWYKNTSGYCIANTHSTDTICNIHNLFFKNIYIYGDVTAFCSRAEDYNRRPFFDTCNFSGVMQKNFTFDSTNTLRFKTCSFNIDLSDKRPFETGYSGHSAGGFFDNCFVRFKSDYSGAFFSDQDVNPIAKDTYFEMTLPNIDNMSPFGHGFDNCVLDITSDSYFNIYGENHPVSIIHGGHAPNATADGTYIKKVPASDWLNVTALHNDYGFNAG